MNWTVLVFKYRSNFGKLSRLHFKLKLLSESYATKTINKTFLIQNLEEFGDAYYCEHFIKVQ